MLTKSKLILASLFAFMSMFAIQARAALPAEAVTALTELKDDATSMLSSIWPVVILVAIGFALMRLFRRGSSAAV